MNTLCPSPQPSPHGGEGAPLSFRFALIFRNTYDSKGFL
jgi:hypothetical protein